MKHFTILSILFLSFMLKADAQSNCIFFTENGEKFWAVINGVKQNPDAQTNVKVQGLVAPSYKCKIIFEDNNLPDLDKTIYFNSPGEYTYNISRNNKGEIVMRALSMVPIVQNAPPAPNQYVVVYGGAPAPQTTTIVTQPVGGTVQQTTTTTTTGTVPNDNVNMNVGMNIGGVGVGMNVNVNDGMSTGSQTTTTYSSTTTTTGGYVDPGVTQTTIVYVPGYGGPIGCPMPMAPGDFESAKQSIASKDFESTKLEIAKQIVGSNCIVADQVKQIMHLFDFESSKLDFAKFAYSHTYDKGNYFKVNDAFDFESSVSDLNSYIGGH
jgi:hypothetical protein